MGNNPITGSRVMYEDDIVTQTRDWLHKLAVEVTPARVRTIVDRVREAREANPSKHPSWVAESVADQYVLDGEYVDGFITCVIAESLCN